MHIVLMGGSTIDINEETISRMRRGAESLMARCSKQPRLLNIFSPWIYPAVSWDKVFLYEVYLNQLY